jgi:CheY-like chemotaxis protein
MPATACRHAARVAGGRWGAAGRPATGQLERFEVVGEAANALSALDAVGRLRPNVVVLDVQLP